MNLRAVAAQSLAPVLKQEQSLQSTFDQGISKVRVNDRALYHELILGTLRKYELLHNIASQLLSKKLKAKDSDVYALILLGLYQLIFLRVPDHAAISETVSATKTLKKIWAKNLVNAVLRNFQREQESLLESAQDHIASKLCVPEWLYKALKEQWPNNVESICETMQVPAPLSARIKTEDQSLEETKQRFKAKNIDAQPCVHSAVGFNIEGTHDVTSLPGFAEGWLSIQDEAAQLAAPLLDAQDNQRVLDACAAPGGKTAAILEYAPKLEELIALEIDEKRIPRIHENLSRLKLSTKVLCANAGELNDWWDQQLFDRILLDAPCSATGVIRRHPDIKLLRRESDLSELAATQKMLLNRLWQTLKPGGILLYATCSILKQENEEQIANFLSEHADANEMLIDAKWGEKRPNGRQLFPQVGGHDGFYYAKLMKS